jgi:outer membrane protein assembly factor BamB
MKSAWQAAVDDAIEAPLATDGKRLFVATRSGIVKAYGLSDGSALWSVDTGPGALGADPDGVVARSPDGTVAGIDPRSGSLRWKVSSGIQGALPPVLDRGTVYVAGRGLAALDAATGRLLWASTDGGEVLAPPTPAGERVLSSEAGGVLRCRSRTTGASMWTFDAGSDVRATLAVAPDGTTFAGAGRTLQAVGRDGAKRKWRWRLGADALLPPELRERSVLLAAHDATLYALNSGNGHLNWRAPLPSRPQSGPLVSGVVVLVACLDNQLVGFDARTGRSLGEMKTTAPILEAPLLVGSRLYAALRSRSVVAYALNLSPAAPLGARASPPRKKKGGAPNP